MFGSEAPPELGTFTDLASVVWVGDSYSMSSGYVEADQIDVELAKVRSPIRSHGLHIASF